ncbi:DUF5916 domain-containing protein [Pontibacter vulgaris]|uniref:DUF5916 domain-containing protein n=1 Tax=Pontibacter vulgaris TaxID=2905679 RepID=UPI001FA7FB53|nr:DUF5916 domain-containing protein [Pontibacter vulgaris]
MLRTPLLLAFLVSSLTAIAGPGNTAASIQKTTSAHRTTVAPVIDGKLEPEVWQQVTPATDFITFDPANGKPSAQKTEVYTLYDNDAVYIGAILYDTAPDSVLTQLGYRDSGENNSDMFGVYFDTYNDKQNAFSFLVSAAGVQTDIKLSQGRQDGSWDAVWASRVQLHDKGWTVEMRIPYSAIRFPKTEVQTWGLNFMRIVRRTREKSYWNHVNNSVDGFVNQSGRLIGVQGVESPVRLQFVPYVSGSVNHYPSNIEGKSNYSRSINGGMDVKYGINDAFTLDMTLVPDFGQTQSDNQILNLSPFEVKYNENRQFFIEGTELFNKAGLFYPRRIGGTPIKYGAASAQLQEGEQLTENPTVTSLVNATKVSGRTKKGLGIGLFNALTRNTHAVAEDAEGNQRNILTDPMTNYNVFVLDQTLKNNSYITFTNTNVTRGSNFYDANVSGVNVRFADKSNTYAVRASGVLSQLFNKYTNSEGKLEPLTLGHKYDATIAKVSGNFLYSLSHNVESDTYEINDLGYLQNNNEMSTSAQVNYNFYQPIWKFLSWGNRLSFNHSMLYAPRQFSSYSFGGGTNVRFRNFVGAWFNWGVRPEDARDYFEARAFPKVVLRPPAADANIGISSDYRKRVALDASTGLWYSGKYNQTSVWWTLSPRLRVNDKLMLINSNDFKIEDHNIGYFGSSTVLGDRNIKTLTTTVSGAYIFNENTGLSLNMRHYWSRVAYNAYYSLLDDGHITPLATEQSLADDINFNQFNIDLTYSWRFAPGSELRLMWKNAIQEKTNTIRSSYPDNFSSTIQAPQSNNISVKLLYFIDYIAIKRVLSA